MCVGAVWTAGGANFEAGQEEFILPLSLVKATVFGANSSNVFSYITMCSVIWVNRHSYCVCVLVLGKNETPQTCEVLYTRTEIMVSGGGEGIGDIGYVELYMSGVW